MLFDEFGEFFRQMPPALVCNIVLIAVSISVLLLYFVVVKPTLARNKASRNAAVAASVDDLPPVNTLTSYAASPPPPAQVIPPRRSGEYTVKLQDGQQARGVEVLAILRDTADDRLIVQLDGVGYRTLLEQPIIKTRFTALMKELAETIARPDTPRSEATYVEPEVESMPAAVQYDPLDDLDLPDLDALSTLPAAPPPPPAPRRPVVSSVPPAADGRMPGALPDYRAQPTEPKKVVKQGMFRAPKVEFEPVPELNLAGAIEAFLQHKLQHSPDYVGRDLHIHAAPGGGVRIQVDDYYYDAVGDIDDADVREFIASTIAEWQEHQ
jgi:hypothetical protein